MVGACVAFVGTFSLIAMLVVGKAVGPASDSTDGTPALVPADRVHGTPPSPGQAPANQSGASGAKPAKGAQIL